jgi:hypothetical protein
MQTGKLLIYNFGSTLTDEFQQKRCYFPSFNKRSQLTSINQCSKLIFRSACVLLKSEAWVYLQKNGERQMGVLYVDKCRYEIQEQKEVTV